MPSVLLEEGDTLLRGLFRLALKRAGFDVREAVNGEEVLAQYRVKPTDVVILLLPLSQGEGLATIGRLSHEFPGVKIVALTGGGDSLESLALAKAIGVRHILRKPVALSDLLRVMSAEGQDAVVRAGCAERPGCVDNN